MKKNRNRIEKGFYSPSIGYWQVIDDPSEDQKKEYPSDTIEVGLPPSENHEFINGAWKYIPPPPPPPPVATIEQLEAAVREIANGLPPDRAKIILEKLGNPKVRNPKVRGAI